PAKVETKTVVETRTEVKLVDAQAPVVAPRVVEVPKERSLFGWRERPTTVRLPVAQVGPTDPLQRPDIFAKLPPGSGLSASGVQPVASTLGTTSAPSAMVVSGPMKVVSEPRPREPGERVTLWDTWKG